MAPTVLPAEETAVPGVMITASACCTKTALNSSGVGSTTIVCYSGAVSQKKASSELFLTNRRQLAI